MKIAEIQGDWPTFKKALQEHYSGLSDEEAETFHAQNRAQLLELIDTRYGVAAPRAEEELDEIMAEHRERHARKKA